MTPIDNKDTNGQPVKIALQLISEINVEFLSRVWLL